MILRAGFERARILVFGFGVASLAPACASDHVGPPPSAPSAARAIDAMPADLDLVVRLDMKRIRDTLGASTMQTISEHAVRGLRGTDQATDALLVSALSETDTLWVGV
ncbi:MAG TPA: hypothetical protein VHV51_18055, partial [Polyangiaceae bacterium]|nr:hypothetical protein [Polyangiaceae bacterium]